MDVTKLMENGLAVLKEIGLDEDEESKQWLLDLWLTALRSERYEQITRKLWRVDRGCDCFCAIGVLANEIQPFTTVNLFREGGEDATYCIADWLTPVDVASYNDEGWTFEQIAKEIERYMSVLNHRAGLCAGWRRGAAACSRMATPGFYTCTYHRHQEETVIAMADPRSSSCNGWNYHVFPLGSNVCSMCGWRKP